MSDEPWTCGECVYPQMTCPACGQPFAEHKRIQILVDPGWALRCPSSSTLFDREES